MNFLEFVKAVAKHLLPDEGYTVGWSKDFESNEAELAKRHESNVPVDLGWIQLYAYREKYGKDTDKVRWSISWPRDKEGRYLHPNAVLPSDTAYTNEVNVSIHKAPEVVAKDIVRRLLNKETIAAYHAILEKMKRDEESLAAHSIEVERVKELFRGYGVKFTCFARDPRKATFYSDGHGVTLEIHNGWMSLSIGQSDTADAILPAVLNYLREKEDASGS